MNKKEIELRDGAIKILGDTKALVDPGYLSEKLGCSWQKARVLLLELAVAKQIEAIETTSGYFYQLKRV